MSFEFPSLLRSALIAVALALVAMPAAAQAPALVPPQGTLDVGSIAGAPYRIEVPALWNGSLVMYLHGYENTGTPRGDMRQQASVDRQLLAKGYAVARSQYSTQGWAIAEAVVDNEALRARFVARHGTPRQTFVVGHSLGAHVLLATMERYPDHYSGGLAMCGANAPAAEIFNEQVLTSLVAFEVYFPGVMGLAPGGLADPTSPRLPNAQAIEAALVADEKKAQAMALRFGVPRNGLARGLVMSYRVLREMMVRAGGFPADNRRTRYTGFGDDVAFNAKVRRYTGDPKAVAYVAAHAAFTGKMQKPLVLMANQRDPIVPPAISSRYPELAAAAGSSANVLVMPPQGEGHCGFTPASTALAFSLIEQWVATGKRPGR